MVAKQNVPEFIGQIIDVFEDFLQERDVHIQNDERTEASYETDHPEDLAIIYGCDYGDLQDALKDLLKNWGVVDG